MAKAGIRGINPIAKICTPILQCNVNKQSSITRNFKYLINQGETFFLNHWPIIKIFRANAQSRL